MSIFQAMIVFCAVVGSVVSGKAAFGDDFSVPENAEVRLSSERETYFLGENVLVHFEIHNTGGAAFTADFGGDYRGAMRSLRFKVTGSDQAGKALADPYPSKFSMGGLGGPNEIISGEPFVKSLPLSRYLRIEKPGTYTINVTHDFGWKLKPGQQSPTGTIKLTFKQPTGKEAEELVEKWLAAPKHNGTSVGQKSKEYHDFSQIKNIAYLPVLKKHCYSSRRTAAFIGLGSIPHRDATAELIKLAMAEPPENRNEDSEKPHLLALQELCQRLPDPMLTGKLGRRNPFENGQLDSRRWLMENSWDDGFTDDVRQLGVKLLSMRDKDSVAAGAYLMECVGTADDALAIIEALNREVAKTVTAELETGIYPRPRGACAELKRAAEMIFQRGFKVPANPSNDGEAIFFCIALRESRPDPSREESRDPRIPPPIPSLGKVEKIRPQGWLKTLDRLLADRTPYVAETALRSAPRPLPIELRHHLGSMLTTDDVDLGIEACLRVRQEELSSFKEPVLAKLKVARDAWLFRRAADAASVLGAEEERLRILVSRLDEPEMLFLTIEAMKTMFSNVSGGGSNTNIDKEAEAKRIKPMWEKFIDQNAEKIRSGEKFELPNPGITPEMFPINYYLNLQVGEADNRKRQRWPTKRRND